MPGAGAIAGACNSFPEAQPWSQPTWVSCVFQLIVCESSSLQIEREKRASRIKAIVSFLEAEMCEKKSVFCTVCLTYRQIVYKQNTLVEVFSNSNPLNLIICFKRQ